jgi:dual specificity tyrosine-phosphorylation-regulated kinase 2/3/4
MGSAIALKSRSTLIPESPTSARGSPDVQDDEQLADAEMEAYIKRRKMRAAAGKKEDLSDVNGFPEDILASEPISQRGE